MALPRLDTPTYELQLPSTGDTIKYRPFLVKEQKLLMMAKESEDNTQVYQMVKDLIASCTFDVIKPEELPIFDIEYIFIKLRAKSVGETVEVTVTCPDDNKTKIDVKVNLDDIEVQMDAAHSNTVQLTSNIKMIMNYPKLDTVDIDATDDYEGMFKMVRNCVGQIEIDDVVQNRIDFSDKELDDFIDSMNTEQFKSVTSFFDTMPKVRHVIQVINPKTKVKGEVLVEGLNNFLV